MKRQIFVCLLAFTLSGCGAIFHGTRQVVQANSAPNGVKIVISPSTMEYTTPASINLKRKTSHVLTFSKEGYASTKYECQRKLSGGIVVLDVLFTGLVGVIVDASTGAWYSLSPDVITVSLEHLGAIDGPKEILVHMKLKGDTLSIESDEPGVKVRVERTE